MSSRGPGRSTPLPAGLMDRQISECSGHRPDLCLIRELCYGKYVFLRTATGISICRYSDFPGPPRIAHRLCRWSWTLRTAHTLPLLSVLPGLLLLPFCSRLFSFHDRNLLLSRPHHLGKNQNPACAHPNRCQPPGKSTGRFRQALPEIQGTFQRLQVKTKLPG